MEDVLHSFAFFFPAQFYSCISLSTSKRTVTGLSPSPLLVLLSEDNTALGSGLHKGGRANGLLSTDDWREEVAS